MLFGGGAWAQSPDLPRRDSQPDNQGTNNSATVPAQSQTAIQIVNSPNNAEPSSEEQQGDFQKFVNNARTDPIVFLTAALLILGIAQSWIAKRQADITEGQNRIVNRQNRIMKTQNALMEASAEAFMTVERAYISIIHRPPGLEFDDLLFNFPGEPVCYNVRVTFLIRNTGNTPATITGFMFQPFLGILPKTPPYDGTPEPVRASLTKDDSFAVHQNWRVPETDYHRTQTTVGLGLYVIGYVDYIDKFGGHHRTGYGRRYRLQADDPASYKQPDGSVDAEADKRRTNLEFVATSGYNYDKKREKGEGNDWDEPRE